MLARVKRKPRPSAGRPARREAERAREKLAAARERLFLLEEGGHPGRPIEVVSAVLVETRALSLRCPRCEGAHALVEHAARTVDGARLREARLRCRQCGITRSVWFRLTSPDLN